MSSSVAQGLALAFKVEPLGMLFALVASSLWIVNSIYSIGYMRANEEPRQTAFYVCFAIALGSTMGIAFAKNLFTLFLFYELLTISTYPLVTHKGNEEAVRAGRLYLLLLLGTSLVLFLPAIIATYALAGTLDFTPGGILGGKAGPGVTALLLALFVFGIGKAAVMPLHFWLPAAMVAPTPVSALLHAVAVVKAGVFTILKVIVLIFGVEALSTTGQSFWLTARCRHHDHRRFAGRAAAGQSQASARLFHRVAAFLCDPWRGDPDADLGRRCRNAYRGACGQQDHAVLCRRLHPHRLAPDRSQPARRDRTPHALDHGRVRYRRREHDRHSRQRRGFSANGSC